jgi:hypothetical protein
VSYLVGAARCRGAHGDHGQPHVSLVTYWLPIVPGGLALRLLRADSIL